MVDGGSNRELWGLNLRKPQRNFLWCLWISSRDSCSLRIISPLLANSKRKWRFLYFYCHEVNRQLKSWMSKLMLKLNRNFRISYDTIYTRPACKNLQLILTKIWKKSKPPYLEFKTTTTKRVRLRCGSWMPTWEKNLAYRKKWFIN